MTAGNVFSVEAAPMFLYSSSVDVSCAKTTDFVFGCIEVVFYCNHNSRVYSKILSMEALMILFLFLSTNPYKTKRLTEVVVVGKIQKRESSDRVTASPFSTL